MGGSELKLCELLGSIGLLDLICSKFNHEYNSVCYSCCHMPNTTLVWWFILIIITLWKQI